MAGAMSITERLYRRLRERTLDGAFAPDERVDAIALAAEEGVSLTPMRNALNRLVGEGLLVSQSNEGFRAPPLGEADLRDLYDCCAALLGLALERTPRGRRPPPPPAADADPARRAEAVFGAVMAQAGNRPLRDAFAGAFARLRPARRVETEWLAGVDAELDRLAAAHEAGDVEALARLVAAYRRRRLRHVARTVLRLRRPPADRTGTENIPG